MHFILTEDDHKPSIEYQRRLNPNMKEKDLKLLKVGIVHSMFGNKWVSLVYVVPKQERMKVVKNTNNDLIPTKMVIGLHM